MAIAQPSPTPDELPIIGLNLGNRNVNPGVFVRGEIDEFTAVDFENWLIPYDAVLEVLQIRTTAISATEIELRSPYKVLRLDPNDIRQDPELGRVFSVAEIRDRFEIGVEFDAFDYAIVFDVPTVNATRSSRREPPLVSLAGLPVVRSPSFGLTLIEPNLTFDKTKDSDWQNRSELLAVGTMFGSSWFARINPGNLLDGDPWQLAEFQILNQSDRADYFFGSQPTFWRGQTPGDFWGTTTIQRRGFTPFSYRNISGGANPTRRLQPNQVTATINGRAEPGTLVQLVTNLQQRDVWDEELVDGSGVYRFTDVPVGRDAPRNYYLLLFPNGSLAAEPVIEAAEFTLLPEQLPTGASALIASSGWRRIRKPDKFIGEFQGLSGGVAYRYGISEDLTLGIGSVYDGDLYGLAELFYQPKGTPLRVAISGLMSTDSDVDAEVVWDQQDLYITLNTNLDRTQYSLNWEVLAGLRLFSRGTWDDFARFGVQYSTSGRLASTILGLNWQTDARTDWLLYQRLDQWTLTHRGDDRSDRLTTDTQLDYRLNRTNQSDFLALGLETEWVEGGQGRTAQDNYLLTAGWHYKSRDRNDIGQSLWQTELGYGVSAKSHGPYALIGTTVVPGLFLEARYEVVTLRANQNRFTFQLRSSLGVQPGFGPGERRPERLRTEGGILVQPFYDFNGNGERDAGESLYQDSVDFLIVDHEVVRSQDLYQEGDRLLLPLSAGFHRIDLEEAGFPPDFQPTITSFAVEVAEGSYTPFPIPLQASYTLMGVVTNADGNPVAGARVEAVDEQGEIVSFSITNSAGVYYLEQLRLGTYRININGQAVGDRNQIIFNPNSDTLEELNLQTPPPNNDRSQRRTSKRRKIISLPYRHPADQVGTLP